MGGWTTEAAQAVLGEGIMVLPVLETLHQASLLQQQIVADDTRFVMLETIREFAREQLTTRNEAEAAHHHHAAYYARFAMTADVELLRADAPRWRARVAAEQDNLRVAFRWALDHQAYVTALHIATGVWRFHWMAGLLREGLERLEAALASREQAPLEVQSYALQAAGILAIGLSDYPRARRWLEAAVEAAWRLDDQYALQPVLTTLGQALLEQGELEDARIYLEESLSLARRAQDPTVAKFPLGFLARLHMRLGDYAQAQAMCEEGLRINQARRDTEGTADALRNLATIVNAQGDALRARQLVKEALALHRSLEHQRGMGLDYAVLGDIARQQSDDAGALAHYHHCLALWQDHDNIVNSVVVLDNIAEIYSRMGTPLHGATLMGTAQAMRERTNIRVPANEQASRDKVMCACRMALGEAAFAAAWAEGRSMTLEQAIAYALEAVGDKSINAETSAGNVQQ
jgi:tetratricopeptide (TPR) repeat protein